MGFLEGFGERFAIALGAWPFASALLTLPILALLYRRDGRLRLGSAAGAYLAVLYGLALAFFTLWPLPEGTEGPGLTYGIPPQLDPFAFVADIASDGAKAVFQIIANVAFFVPCGFFARRGLRLGLPASAALGLALSLLIETAQLTGAFGLYPYAWRTFDVDDLAWNAAGAVLGWLAAAQLARLVPERAVEQPPVTRHPGLLRRLVAFGIDMALVGLAAIAAMGSTAGAALLLGADPSMALGLAGLGGSATAMAAFVAVEGVVPWCCDGSTPGGAFVRMSCEGRSRATGRRVGFYLARLATILACLSLWPVPLALVAVPVVGVFDLAAREMPYDLL